jgi:putative endonuclease
MFFIYFLYSEKSGIYYVGHTEDYLRRFEQHNQTDRDTFTKKHRLWKLIAVFECGNQRNEALKIEKFIKKQKSRKLIEKIIAGDEMNGLLAQLVRVPDVRD